MKILIKNGKILDPANNLEAVMDLKITDGKIEKISEKIEEDADEILDGTGCYIMPGFIDLHVHLRDPGLTDKETIETGAAAAAAGGYTTICAMPNTKPVADNPEVIHYVHEKGKATGINVLQIGAITVGQEGNVMADIEGMVQAGIPAISEDGKSVMDVSLYRKAMQKAAALNIPVFAHCEDKTLVGKGVVQEGFKAEELGVDGISNAVEDVITARDIILAKDTGAQLHLCHCSTKDSVDIIREGQKYGVNVTAEVCPHHFTLSVEDMPGGDTNYKMNPPLRNKEDVEALKAGLKEGIFTVIATDHAPHTAAEKENHISKAPFGIVGSETAAALTYSELVETGILTPMQMAEYMSYNPAKVLHSDKGTLSVGADADVVIFNPEEEYEIDVNKFFSKGKNTPFNGRKVKGKVKATIASGKVVYRNS